MHDVSYRLPIVVLQLIATGILVLVRIHEDLSLGNTRQLLLRNAKEDVRFSASAAPADPEQMLELGPRSEVSSSRSGMRSRSCRRHFFELKSTYYTSLPPKG
jgi:hypothetical protein